MLKSLLILGVPRSMTTLTCNLICDTTSLEGFPEYAHEPMNTRAVAQWAPNTQDEEIQAVAPYRKSYTLDETQTIHNLFNAHTNGRLIKDVTHVNITVPYLREHQGTFNTIFLNRSPADIAYSIWLHPMVWGIARLCDDVPDTHTQGDIGQMPKAWRMEHIVRGVLHMHDAYKSVAGVVVDQERMTEDYTYIFNVLTSLGYTTKPKDYIGAVFKVDREGRRARRGNPLWNAFNELAQA